MYIGSASLESGIVLSEEQIRVLYFWRVSGEYDPMCDYNVRVGKFGVKAIGKNSGTVYELFESGSWEII